MKEHRSISARHDKTGQMIPHSTFSFFTTGEYGRAVQEGMRQASMTGSYTIVPVHTFQTINHGVEDDDAALKCGACHDDEEFGTQTPRMDLVGDLGYQIKGSVNQVCSQCHSLEDSEGFIDLHQEHVQEEGKDCSWCHTFSRPERNLSKPQ
jgi:hypothetical protein